MTYLIIVLFFLSVLIFYSIKMDYSKYASIWTEMEQKQNLNMPLIIKIIW
jgi:hypothetical protein